MYCASRYQARRRLSREVRVGNVLLGGSQPVRVQSMTTTPTQDVAATVRQSIALAEAGCEIIRITAPNKAAAAALKDIAREFRAAGFSQPLVADIHFLPAAAMEAVEHVEKVRVNPGNYADKKKFAVREYTDAAYAEELERLHEDFSPLVLRAKELGRALRIGTNHGSLSDRIMNRYGDSPLGMAESALEFIRICEHHGFRDLVLSMKSSNPKVMIEAYRVVVEKMLAEDMRYPLHLGVTEAGDGDDARIKSAIGIGSLLFDGLGDTIRVSLTEDPVYEVPVARDLARKAERLWAEHAELPPLPGKDSIDPYHYARRAVDVVHLSPTCKAGSGEPPRVIIPWSLDFADPSAHLQQLAAVQARLKDARIEGLLVTVSETRAIVPALAQVPALLAHADAVVLELPATATVADLPLSALTQPKRLIFARRFTSSQAAEFEALLTAAQRAGFHLAAAVSPNDLARLAPVVLKHGAKNLILASTEPDPGKHPVGTHRALAEVALGLGCKAPLWIRATEANRIHPAAPDFFGDRLLDASIHIGSLLADGLGDLVSVETVEDAAKASTLAFNILQGARSRVVKTEYVACPSCGRTLFDLQTTTQAIRARTGHLKGVTIAIMGCIVNGPGEMADADFGYVGGAPGKVNLYVGKECVQYNLPEEHAVDRLIGLIKERGRWFEPA